MAGAVRLGLMLTLMLSSAACGSEETVLLEAEELVWEDGSPDSRGDAADVQEQQQEGTGTESVQIAGEQVETSPLFVHICGEVVQPGVYELPVGSRIYEAVEAAGGFTADAAENYVNLAQILEDGCKIEIPSEEALQEQQASKADGMIGMIPGTGVQETQKEELIDINTATKSELCSLPGIGDSRAEGIIAYREKNGGFTRIEDIMKVEGIKEGMFSKMKDKICVRGVK